MNSGGEPERDDTGLPPVDIEIPDDARELDRDVQAYYREQRAERRRLRHRRLHGVLTRDGFLLPLLACCLILALITGTLLTVFTATSGQNLTQLPGPGPNPQLVPTRGPLPAGTLRVTTGGPAVQLQRLHKTILVLLPAVPPDCGCSAGVNWLADIAAGQHALIYLVSTPKTAGEASQLHSQLANFGTDVPVAADNQGMLAHKYLVKGLTAVIVAQHSPAGQSAAYAQNLRRNDNSLPLEQALDG